jgi:hypothetical protein
MGLCATVLAAIVALVFATAAALKLGDRPGTIEGFVAMGFVKNPSSNATLGLFVGVVGLEMAMAIALVVVPPVGAVLGLGLLGVFTAVLVRTARSRPAVRCACFGSASARPIGLATFVRNALLMVALVPAIARLFTGDKLQPSWGLGSLFFGVGAALLGFVLVQLAIAAEDTRARTRAGLKAVS